MPGKTGRSKRRHPPLGKKKKSRGLPSATPAQQPPVSPPQVPASSRVASPPAEPTTIRYPYIYSELRRIAILSGVILAILVVLSLVLS